MNSHSLAPLLAAAAALSLAACGAAEKPEPPKTETAEATEIVTATATAKADGETVTTEKRIIINADGKTGELAVDLADGTGASLRLPPDVMRKIGEDSKVDIDGVGLYPGARVVSMAIASSEKNGTKNENVDIDFTAPSAPSAVADWYVAAFREKGHTATRQGNSVTATTKDGGDVAIDLTADGKGSKGTIKVVETRKA
jgi:hypothetical protein